jgi:hypothetical protein
MPLRSRSAFATGLLPGTPAAALARESTSSEGVIWFAALVVAICFEGLGRKTFRQVPPWLFYFAKDAVLFIGIFRFGFRREIRVAIRKLFGAFGPIMLLAVVWTVLELLNPEQTSLQFGILGLRSYWLWWLAPFPIAAALREHGAQQRAMVVLAATAIVVAVVAALQFSLPADDPLNAYASIDGFALPIEHADTTGRVRVVSTFSYINGFTAFVVIVPPLLLSVGIGRQSSRVRILAVAAAILSAVVLPMSASRQPVVLSTFGLFAVCWYSGLFGRSAGRRALAAGAVAAVALIAFAPDAIEGVRGRFQLEDTRGRFLLGLQHVPFAAAAIYDYPLFGQGTGMQQNGAQMLHIERKAVAEGEPGRYLLELGIIGYALLTLMRIGLALSLIRTSRLLCRQGRRPQAGFAIALVPLAFIGQLTFDHVFQALFFCAVGVLLADVSHGISGTSGMAGRPLSKSPKQLLRADGHRA